MPSVAKQSKSRATERTDTSVRTCTLTLKGVSPYSANAEVARANPKRTDETNDQHEERTWRHRLNTDREGNAIIPGMAVVNCLVGAARFLDLKIPGEGKKTYAKLMEKCLLPNGDVVLGIKAADVPGEWLHVPSDGRKGGGSRVWKCFPRIDDWTARVEVTVIGNKLTEEVVSEIATAAGRFIGLGRFRPERGGFYGRFAVAEIAWRDDV